MPAWLALWLIRKKPSGDGRYVAFISVANGLAPGDANNRADAFVRDLVNGTTEQVNLNAAG